MNEEKGTLLLIDDNQGFRRIYKDRLENDGYSVEEAENGQEGLDRLKKGGIDLVICDIVMPVMDGHQVLKSMMQDPTLKGIPVIVLSVMGGEEEVKKGLGEGAADYLVKGIYSPNEVLSKVSALLARTNIGQFSQRYEVALNTTKYDAAKLAQDLGFTNLYMCERCKGEKKLELIPQMSHRDWFDAHFTCDCTVKGL